MIQEYLKVIYNKINSHFATVLKKENVIKIVNNCELNELSENMRNKILMNLVGIRLENTDMNSRYYEQHGDNYIKMIIPIYSYVFIYFHSTFVGEKTDEGLSYISEIISYFHTNFSFTSKNTNEII